MKGEGRGGRGGIEIFGIKLERMFGIVSMMVQKKNSYN